MSHSEASSNHSWSRSSRGAQFLTLTLGPLLVSIDAAALFTAMPVLARHLGTDLSLASLAVVLYTLMFAGLILPIGWFIDRADGFRLLRAGYLLFAAGSVACMAAADIFQLCAGRCLQGVGGAVLYAAAPVLVKRAVDARRQDRGYAQIAIASQLGVLIGPPVGGVITTLWGWQWIFGVNLPLSLLGLVLLRNRTAPPAPDAGQEPLDLPGALFSFAACALFIIVINQGKELGWGSLPVLLLGAGCLLCTALFIGRQVSCPHPLIDLGLLRLPKYRAALMTACMAMLIGAGLAFLYPFFLTERGGLSLAKSGLFLMIEPTCAILLGSCAAEAMARWGAFPVIVFSMMARVGAALMIAAVAGAPPLAVVGLAFILAGAASGLQYGPLMSAVMGALPSDRAGVGGALFSQSRLMAQMTGILMFESLFSELRERLHAWNGGTSGADAFSCIFLLAAGLLAFTALLSRGLRERRDSPG